MTIKQDAIKLIKEKGCSYEFERADYPRKDTTISILPPENKTIDGLELGLVCRTWEEVIERLSIADIY